jgi:transmembrane sensor
MENIVEFPDTNLIEKEAAEWILKLEADSDPPKKDIEALNAWMVQSSVHREIFVRLASQWDDMDLLSELRGPANQITRVDFNGLTTAIVWLFTPVLLLMAAASSAAHLTGVTTSRLAVATSVMVVGVVVALSSWLIIEAQSQNDAFYITSIGEQYSSTLEDGTVLWLNTNSKVEVRYTKNRRRIYLHKGEAHFEVHSNPMRPFEVVVGKRMVRATGTAFSVFLDNDNVKVTVTEGSVDLGIINPRSVLSPDMRHVPNKRPKVVTAEVVGSLAAGQSILLAAEQDREMHGVVTHEQQVLARRLSWLDGQLVFAGENLEEVVKEVSRYTSLTIELEDPKLKRLRIGGQFQVGETEALFDVLESGFGLKVTRLNKQHVKIHKEK